MAKKRRNGARARASVDVNASILQALEEGELSTAELATELGITKSSAYGRCRRLQEKGVLTCKHRPSRGPMWCMDEKKAITRLEYDRCQAEGHDLRPIDGVECVWRLAKR